jgi:NADH-quinone oxidoreductase subunit C
MALKLNENLQQVVDSLAQDFPDALLDVYQSSGDTFLRIKPEANVEICRYLKSELHFIYLSQIFGADRFTTELRFEVIYNLVSLRDRERLFVKVWLPEENPEIESITTLWESADWYERQVYDMFGVTFTNHPDMRRIYMPEDYEYFPLRKEFPLLGIPGSIELPSSSPEAE